MRLLCLHGVGGSAEMLERLLQPLMKAVDPTYEFVFVDGPVSCARGPGIPAHVDGPFFTHTASYAPHHIAEALLHFERTVNERGPFDGMLGFSQGAALILAYLYQQQVRHETVLFGFALIFSSVLPAYNDLGYLEDVLERLKQRGQALEALIGTEDLPPMEDEQLFATLMQRTIIAAKNSQFLLPDVDLEAYTEGDSAKAPRFMHPQLLKERIQVPTVHITGTKDFDFMRNMSEAACGLCDERWVRKLEHSGGHCPPRKKDEVEAVVRAMDWAMEKSHRWPNLRL